MRTRTIKKEIIPYIVCAGLFALAGVLQYIDNEVSIFWDKLLSLVINLIFFCWFSFGGTRRKTALLINQRGDCWLLLRHWCLCGFCCVTSNTIFSHRTKRQAAIYGIFTTSRNVLCRRLRGSRQWGWREKAVVRSANVCIWYWCRLSSWFCWSWPTTCTRRRSCSKRILQILKRTISTALSIILRWRGLLWEW